jgi:hypothetical protein
MQPSILAPVATMDPGMIVSPVFFFFETPEQSKLTTFNPLPSPFQHTQDYCPTCDDWIGSTTLSEQVSCLCFR